MSITTLHHTLTSEVGQRRQPDRGLDLEIRCGTDADIDQVHEIVTSPHILDGTLRLPYSTVAATRERFVNRSDQMFLVAVTEGRVVGALLLVTYPQAPRHHHVAEIDLVLSHPDWRGRGVATRLMRSVIEMADEWMAIHRLQLIVFTTNHTAIRLYERLGFEIEGTMRGYGFARGQRTDAHIMARLSSDQA